MSHTAGAGMYPVIRENERDGRQRFFEQLLAGGLTEGEIRHRGEKLELNLRAQCYTIAIISAVAEPNVEAGAYAQPAARIYDGMISYFLKYPEFLLLSRDFGSCTVLMMCDTENMSAGIRRCVDTVKALYETHDPTRSWYIAVGTPTREITGLAACFEETQRLWAYRYILPEQHVLRWDTVGFLTGTGTVSLEDIDVTRLDAAAISALLKKADPAEISAFVDNCVDGYREALKSGPFCHYLMLSVRFGATAFVQSLGVSRQGYLDSLDCLDMVGRHVTVPELKRYLSRILLRALELRDRDGKHRDPVKRAMDYLDENYSRADLCLNMVAREVNVSPNYLSAVFSRERGETIVDYLTARRMEKARELLRNTDLRSGQIAAAVGYKDPRYFSTLFRKIHGCTPGAYRTEK